MIELWMSLGLGFLALVARLVWQARREHERQRTVRALAGTAPRGGAVEIDEVRGDGSRLTVRINGRGR